MAHDRQRWCEPLHLRCADIVFHSIRISDMTRQIFQKQFFLVVWLIMKAKMKGWTNNCKLVRARLEVEGAVRPQSK